MDYQKQTHIKDNDRAKIRLEKSAFLCCLQRKRCCSSLYSCNWMLLRSSAVDCFCVGLWLLRVWCMWNPFITSSSLWQLKGRGNAFRKKASCWLLSQSVGVSRDVVSALTRGLFQSVPHSVPEVLLWGVLRRAATVALTFLQLSILPMTHGTSKYFLFQLWPTFHFLLFRKALSSHWSTRATWRRLLLHWFLLWSGFWDSLC